jgi:hypothetical protein
MKAIRIVWPLVIVVTLGAPGCGGGSEKTRDTSSNNAVAGAGWPALPLRAEGISLGASASLFDVRSSRQIVDLSADGVLRVEGEALSSTSEAQGYCYGILHTLDPAPATPKPGEPQVTSVDLKSCRLIPARVSVLDDQGAFPGLLALDIPQETVAGIHVGTDRICLFSPAGVTAEQIRSLPARPVKFDDQSLSRFLAGNKADLKRRSERAEKARQQEQYVPLSTNNLKQIGLAFHNFNSANGCFPPAVVNGPDGEPWHSWRVLILVQLGQAALYNTYRFDEPWDGPNNIKLLDKMPEVYRKPGDHSNFTHYVVPTGPDVAFSSQAARIPEKKEATKVARKFDETGPGLRRIKDFTDGTSNTILVGTVEPDRKIYWSSPVDQPMAFPSSVPGPAQAAPRSRKTSPLLKDPNGFATPYDSDEGLFGLFGFADGSVRTIHKSIDDVLFSSLLTFSGGEPISANSIAAGSTSLTTLPQAVYKLEVITSGGEPVVRFQEELKPPQPAPVRGSERDAAPSSAAGASATSRGR